MMNEKITVTKIFCQQYNINVDNEQKKYIYYDDDNYNNNNNNDNIMKDISANNRNQDA
jgi:hypothetical protein